MKVSTAGEDAVCYVTPLNRSQATEPHVYAARNSDVPVRMTDCFIRFNFQTNICSVTSILSKHEENNEDFRGGGTQRVAA